MKRLKRLSIGRIIVIPRDPTYSRIRFAPSLLVGTCSSRGWRLPCSLKIRPSESIHCPQAHYHVMLSLVT